jgi:hypothetical protein
MEFKPGKYPFTSADSGRRYVLTILDSKGDENSFRCSCRGFTYHGHCKHVGDAILFSEIPVGQLNSDDSNDTTHNKEKHTMKKNHNQPAATSKKVVVRRRRPAFPMGVPLNIKVAGERTMRKGVRLAQHPSDPTLVRVLTGSRGRPSHLPVASIEKVRAL